MSKKEIALNYLEKGFSIIPLKGKVPRIEWTKYQSQKPTEEEVDKWFEEWPETNIGIVTGAISNIVVVDVDGGEMPTFPPTPSVQTSPGKRHFYFKYPGFSIPLSVKKIAENIDIRADGGQVVAPPSQHFNKETGEPDFEYTWIVSPEDIPFAPLPDWIIKKIQDPNTRRVLEDIVRNGSVNGSRNNDATSLVGSLLSRYEKKQWEEMCWPLIQSWNNDNEEPLNEKELRTVFDSIAKAESGKITNEDRKTTSDNIVELAINLGVELFLDQSRTVYVVFPDKQIVGYPINNSYVKSWIIGKYWEKHKKGISENSFNEAKNSLEGKAIHEGKTTTFYNRIARIDNKIYYDLGDDINVVEISELGWKIISDCTVKFRRFSHQLPQVLPQNKGDFSLALKYFNLINEDDKCLLSTYLITAFIPNIPRVVLIHMGDQGSAKSTGLRVVRSIIDPSQAELLSPPSNITELSIASNHNYCFFVDNLSQLSGEMSDALCRLATGTSFTRRKLYTDDDEIILTQKPAIGITGINLVAQKADLLDRCLILNFVRIPDNERLEEEAFWENFNNDKPQILAGIFDKLSETLKLLPNFKITNKPRMADYAKYAAAVAQVLGYETTKFFEAFGKNINRQNKAAIDSSPVAQTIIKFMESRTSWHGSSTELYEELSQIANDLKLPIGAHGFPRSPAWISRKVKLVRPNLASLGIEVKEPEENTIGSFISINKIENSEKNTAIVAIETNHMAVMAIESETKEETSLASKSISAEIANREEADVNF